MNKRIILTVTIIFLLSVYTVAEMVPFVIPVDVHPDSEIAMISQSLTEQDRLSAEEHFVDQSGRRVRIWGINMTYAANFPSHKDAQRIAKRLAAAGINSVRFHLMDAFNWPEGIWDENGKDLHPEAMDLLDYFIDQLAQVGIYANINLHVGKVHSEMFDMPKSPLSYSKIVTLFVPELIESQKAYARALLTHKNPYRGNVAYTDDHAVAFVEITNENSFFLWGAENALRKLPAYYADILQKQYNLCLQKKYGTTEKLRQAWSKDIEPMGDQNLLQSLTPENGWHLEQQEQTKAEIIAKKDETSGLKIKINKIDGDDMHLRYNHPGLKFEKGRYYTLSFKARAAANRSMHIDMTRTNEQRGNLGLLRTIKLTPQWQTFMMGFYAKESAANARLNFALGDHSADIEFATIELYAGGQVALHPDESIEQSTVTLFAKREVKARSIDRLLFLAETEKTYFDDMYNYIKQDLRCKALVTGTIVLGPLGLYAQSDMDYVDSHAYWQHPKAFEKPSDWWLEQKVMSNHPEDATLYKLSAQQLSGKPFTVSEYNHPAPLDSQAECVPMVASFAAAQDWDGVWLYTYARTYTDWDRQMYNRFFDMDANPAKWGFVLSGSKIFRDTDIEPLHPLFTGIAMESPEVLAALHLKVDRYLIGAVELTKDQPITPRNASVSGKTRLDWTVVDGKGLYLMQTGQCRVLTGTTERFESVLKGQVKISEPKVAAVTIISLDGKPLDAGSSKILITACGRCENTGMQFSTDRSTVGRNWGTAPVQIEPVEGVVTLLSLFSETPMTCKVLNPDGTVKKQFAVKNGMVPLKAQYGTMWYLLER